MSTLDIDSLEASFDQFGQIFVTTGSKQHVEVIPAINYRLPITPLRRVMNWIEDKVYNSELFDEDYDEAAKLMNQLSSSVGSMTYPSQSNGREMLLQKEMRRVHGKVIEALPKPVLVVGDANCRVLNWDMEDVYVFRPSNPDRSKDKTKIIMDWEGIKKRNFRTCYVMYFSEMTMEAHAGLLRHFSENGRSYIESHIDYVGVSKSQDPMVTVDLIRDDDKYIFFNSMVCGFQFFDINPKFNPDFTRYDMSHFLRVIGGQISEVSKYLCVYTCGRPFHENREVKTVPVNSGLPVTSNDDSLIQLGAYVVAEKLDGKCGTLVVGEGKYVVRKLSGRVVRSGTIKDEGFLKAQVEILPDRIVITDVYDSRLGSGGFLYRWQIEKEYRAKLALHGIFFQQWYMPDKLEDVYRTSKEGIVIQRIYSPPGPIPTLHAQKRYGSARYIKKRPTVDIQMGTEVHECDAKDYFSGQITLIRKRLDKKEPNTPFQMAMIKSAYTLEQFVAAQSKPYRPYYVKRRENGVVYGTNDHEMIQYSWDGTLPIYDFRHYADNIAKGFGIKYNQRKKVRIKYNYGPITAKVKYIRARVDGCAMCGCRVDPGHLCASM